MGLFSRSNSSASRRSHQQQVAGPRAASPSGSLASKYTNGEPERKIFPRWRLGSLVHSTASSASQSRTDLTTSPDIPLRTSSKDATLVNQGAVSPKKESLARTLLRGRTPSKLSISSTYGDPVGPGNTSPMQSRSVSRQESKASSPTRSISSPTAFKHMTHIKPEQYARLASTSENDLAADFSALRASQSLRRDFRGIKTMEIHSRTSSVETTATSHSRSESQLSAATSCTNSTRNSVQSIEPAAAGRSRGIRVMRSQDSFSQPFLNGRPPKIAAGPQPTPPRKSSMKAVTRAELAKPQEENTASAHERAHSLESIDETQDASATSQPHSSNSDVDYMQNGDYVTPGEESWQTGTWPLPSFGQVLPAVSEEEGHPTAARSDKDYQLQLDLSASRSYRHSRSEPISSGSSSEESSATITAVTFTHSNRKKVMYADTNPWSYLSRYRGIDDRRASMDRSSISSGLFTGWAIDEADSGESTASPQAALLTLSQPCDTPMRVESRQDPESSSHTETKDVAPSTISTARVGEGGLKKQKTSEHTVIDPTKGVQQGHLRPSRLPKPVPKLGHYSHPAPRVALQHSRSLKRSSVN